MDFRTRDQAWLCELNDTLLNDEIMGGENLDKSVQKKIFRYKDLLRRRTRAWWNKAFLEKYLERGLIPRGLRVRVVPSCSIDDVSFKREWEALASTCSNGFMKLLSQLNSTLLSDMETEMEKLQSCIYRQLTTEQKAKFEDEIKLLVLKWEKEVKDVKIKKFQRDVNDRKLDQVYRWRTDRSRSGYSSASTSRSRSTSVQSLTSGEGSQGEPVEKEVLTSGDESQGEAVEKGVLTSGDESQGDPMEKEVLTSGGESQGEAVEKGVLTSGDGSQGEAVEKGVLTSGDESQGEAVEKEAIETDPKVLEEQTSMPQDSIKIEDL
ncbi:uncharacterized protein ACNLHF_017336 [Anomaloglossus baeobatrachus]|uniref:uncharacterized protein LOC142301712 n=1 Tax=Anomaloglossus baeobatrachus TaxID=238106 RepID=UPI003F4F7A69